MTCIRSRLTSFICIGLMATMTMTAAAPRALAVEPTAVKKSEDIMVRQPGDTLKTCDELWNEALTMREVIARTRMKQNDNKMTDRGIGAAGAVASMLIGTATGGIGIAAAGLAARAATEARTEEAEAIQEAAQQRRALMAGIFMIKDCPGPIENALSDIKVMSAEEKALAAMAPAGGAPIGPIQSERTAGKQTIVTGEKPANGYTNGPYRAPYKAPKGDKPLND